MTMTDDSVGMVAERAPPLFGAIISIAVGMLTIIFLTSQGTPDGSDPMWIFIILVPLAFCGGGLFFLRQHLRGVMLNTLVHNQPVQKGLQSVLHDTSDENDPLKGPQIQISNT